MDPAADAGTLQPAGPLGDYAVPALAGGSLLVALVLALLGGFFLARSRAAPSPPPTIPADLADPVERAPVPRNEHAPRSLEHDGDVPPTVPGARPRLSLPPGRLSFPPGALVDRKNPPGTPRSSAMEVHDVSRPPNRPSLDEPSDWLGRLRKALGRSRDVLRSRLDTLFGTEIVDERAVDELEEALIRADVGVPTSERLIKRLKTMVRAGQNRPDELRAGLRDELLAAIGPRARMVEPAERPWIMLVVGVNGSGKTTTVGKLAARFRRDGKYVVIAAADTYRAAASDQLAVWAARAGAELVTHQPGADPAAVVFDSLAAAKARNADIVLIDTAGRLQTTKPLMEQLAKIRRVVDRAMPGAPHETLLVLDGTMGQNALSQARLFHEATPLTGVVVTKLDGTAKGGVVIAIASELGLPVKLIGIGEKVEDLRDFEPEAFVDALL